MTLLDSMKEEYVMMDKTTVNDELGGFRVVWVEGAHFDAVIRKDWTIEHGTIAQQDIVDEPFTVVVDKSVTLEFHDVFKRISDGAVFRMTSNIQDGVAPDRSTVKIAKATAERWSIQ